MVAASQSTPEQGKQLKYFSSRSAILIPTCEEASTEMKPSAVYVDNDFQSSVLRTLQFL